MCPCAAFGEVPLLLQPMLCAALQSCDLGCPVLDTAFECVRLCEWRSPLHLPPVALSVLLPHQATLNWPSACQPSPGKVPTQSLPHVPSNCVTAPNLSTASPPPQLPITVPVPVHQPLRSASPAKPQALEQCGVYTHTHTHTHHVWTEGASCWLVQEAALFKYALCGEPNCAVLAADVWSFLWRCTTKRSGWGRVGHSSTASHTAGGGAQTSVGTMLSSCQTR